MPASTDRQPTRIGINAVLLTRGGAAVALDKLLSEFVRLRPELEYHVVFGRTLPALASMEHKSVHRYLSHFAGKGQFSFALWHFVGLPIWLIRHRIDTLFTHTCYLPPILTKKTVLLMQDARYFSDSFRAAHSRKGKERARFRFKQLWAFHSVRTADMVVVQTKTLANSIVKRIPSVAPRLRVVPHGPGYLDKAPPCLVRPPRYGEPLELLCVSLFRAYKDFSTLVRALKVLCDARVPARLHLTLDGSDPEVHQLWRCARELDVDGHMVNHGELESKQLSELYRSSHVFVFSSISESFGFPLIEAMSFGMPVFAADTAVNREICEGAATYFPPGDAAALGELLRSYYERPESWLHAGKTSAQRAMRFRWDEAGKETLDLILRA